MLNSSNNNRNWNKEILNNNWKDDDLILKFVKQ